MKEGAEGVNEAASDDEALDDLDESTDSGDDFLRAVARAPSVAERVPSETIPLTRVAQFRIVEKIGSGGMGIVYRAEDEKLERVVALKVLPGNFDDDEERRRRFLREARVAAAITHPNVAAVHEIGEADGRIYIAMELVQGETLREHLRHGPLDVTEAIEIAKSIARGVARAHARGIAHRDLKPDNVMVASDGAIKVLDFGLAKPTRVRETSAPTDEGATQTSLLTQEGRIIGTPGYMSPEQATGKNVGVRTDVFSLGVMLYEMVTGARPFGGETPMDVVIATSRDTPLPLSRRRVDLPRGLEACIQKCLEKDASARYATADELLAALEAIDVRATSSGAASKWRAAAVAFAGAVAFGLLVWRVSAGDAPPPPVASTNPPPPATTSAGAFPAPVVAPSATSLAAEESTKEPAPTAPPTPATSLTSREVRRRAEAQHRPDAGATVAGSTAVKPAAAAPISPGGVIQESPY